MQRPWSIGLFDEENTSVHLAPGLPSLHFVNGEEILVKIFIAMSFANMNTLPNTSTEECFHIPTCIGRAGFGFVRCVTLTF